MSGVRDKLRMLGTVVLTAVLTSLFWIVLYSRSGGEAPQMQNAAPQPPVTTATVLAPSGLAVPVAGVAVSALTDTWGDARANGRSHEAIDIMAPRGTPVIAAAAGRVEKLFESDAGGHTAYVRSDDGNWIYYYAHLDSYAPGLAEGQHLDRGAAIGGVGDTGNAGAGNTHLHFGINRMTPGAGWWQGEAINPYPLLAGRPAKG